MSDRPFTEREGILLTIGQLLRKVADGYSPETVKAALLSTNTKEANQLQAHGFMDPAAEAAAGMCQGALEGVAETIEKLSQIDDRAWDQIVRAMAGTFAKDNAPKT